jgi:hypothetical protein
MQNRMPLSKDSGRTSKTLPCRSRRAIIKERTCVGRPGLARLTKVLWPKVGCESMRAGALGCSTWATTTGAIDVKHGSRCSFVGQKCD